MKKWNRFTTKEIKPGGWLKRQLQIQAEGLCGNLDKVWRDVRDSAWIGGDADGWERVPYWLDGFIPLAYLSEDEHLISRAEFYVKSILSKQKPDGWICPCADNSAPDTICGRSFLSARRLPSTAVVRATKRRLRQYIMFSAICTACSKTAV